MQPWSYEFAGRFEEHEFQSDALKGNPLGDPHVRPLWVYLPPGYDDEPERRYPSIYVIQGLTGQVDMWAEPQRLPPELPRASRSALRGGRDATLHPRLGRRVDVARREPVRRLTGHRELPHVPVRRARPFIDREYRTMAEAAHRGIAGKSSGGYGAMITPMLRPDLFGGLATHAGDALFEVCYEPDFRASVRALRDHYDGSYDAFWADFRSRPAFDKKSDYNLLNDWCMAACYSTDEDGTVRMPFDPATGRLLPEVWERWLAWDPVRMAPTYADALGSLRAIYIDAGTRDEWFLDLGAEAFRRALEEIGVTDVFFELFDGTHMGIDYRYPLALKYLAERLV